MGQYIVLSGFFSFVASAIGVRFGTQKKGYDFGSFNGFEEDDVEVDEGLLLDAEDFLSEQIFWKYLLELDDS